MANVHRNCSTLVAMLDILALPKFPRFRSMARFGLCLLLYNAIPCASSQLAGAGFSVVLNDISYYVSPFSSGHVDSDLSILSFIDSIYGFVPVTIVQERVTTAELGTLFSNWSTADDVFQSGFTSAIFLGSNSKSFKFTRATDDTTTYRVSATNATAPSGPYFLEKSTGSLHRVYRLYDDFAGSFTMPLLQTPQGTFQTLSAHIASSATLTVGVPSRLYFTKTSDKPLAGVRVGVKVRCKPCDFGKAHEVPSGRIFSLLLHRTSISLLE